MTKLLCVPLVFLLAACGPSQAELQAAAEAEQARIEQAADVLAGQYDEAVGNGNWELARIHGAALLVQYPRTAAGLRVQPGFQATQDKASELRELQRLQSLWHYAQVPAPGGTQRSALIYSKNTVDVDGSGPRTVELVFRDHPQWKRSAYLILPTGDFDCYGGCNAKVSADGGPARTMPGYRPDTKEAIAMFINNDKALWRLARNSKAIEIEFPVKAGGTRTALFESGGLKDEHMPGWD